MALDFLKRGKAAQEVLNREEEETELRQSKFHIRRFWLPKGGETQITFLDGVLGPDGLLDAPTYLEHQVYMNGTWTNWFPCTEEKEPCPICAMGNFHATVALFTVIDHSEFKDRNGLVHRNERRLFVAKRDTLKRLQKLASRRGGLVGWTVGVSRIGEKSAGVGTDFEALEQNSIQALIAKYNLSPQDAVPFSYDDGKTVRYYKAQQLRVLGFSGGAGVMASTPVEPQVSGTGQSDLPFDDDL